MEIARIKLVYNGANLQVVAESSPSGHYMGIAPFRYVRGVVLELGMGDPAVHRAVFESMSAAAEELSREVRGAWGITDPGLF